MRKYSSQQIGERVYAAVCVMRARGFTVSPLGYGTHLCNGACLSNEQLVTMAEHRQQRVPARPLPAKHP